MRLGTRIRMLRREKKMTQSQLGACFNLAESTISLYESGKRSPDYEILCKLALYFQVSIDYLLGHTNERRQPDLNPASFNPDEYNEIPLVTSVLNTPAGIVYEKSAVLENQNTYDPEETELIWVQLNSEAMSGDAILLNDFALVRKQTHLEYGEVGLVAVETEPGAIYRVFKKEKSIVLQSSHPLYPPRIFAGKELSKVKIVGKVIEIRRKL